MRVSHSVAAVFDDPNLISRAGMAPTALARRCGLGDLVAGKLTLKAAGGVKPP